MKKNKGSQTTTNTELDQKIRQMRERLQQLDAQTSKRTAELTKDAEKQAREIISRAESEAKNIKSDAYKEFAQISRNECSSVVINRQQMEKEIRELQKEKETLSKELDELSGQISGMTTEDGSGQSLTGTVQQPARPVVKTSEEQIRESMETKKRHWPGVLATIFILILAGILAFQLLVGVTVMRDNAMEDSVSKGDKIVYSRISRQPHTNDLTVFKNKAGLVCVRRAIGRAGDTVDYDPITNRIQVNGKAIPNVPDDVEWWGVENSFSFPVTVQEGEVFVLSSNREQATNEGLIKTDQVKGKVLKIF